MLDVLVWAAIGTFVLCLFVFLIDTGPPPLPQPAYEVPNEVVASGPHTIIARGQVDDGYFVLLRTPLYEFPLNAALITQVVFDTSGALRFARYCRVETLNNGLVEAGHVNGKPVTVRVGSGSACQSFPTAPETIWTH